MVLPLIGLGALFVGGAIFEAVLWKKYVLADDKDISKMSKEDLAAIVSKMSKEDLDKLVETKIQYDLEQAAPKDVAKGV